MVRASLVKSDPLMRSLGRPNRDQIVSMRPTDLTTLQAIDLANAKPSPPPSKKVPNTGSPPPTPTLPPPSSTVSTSPPSPAPPTADESTAATEMLGPQPTTESLQDLLWALFMLPEFQLVR